MVMERQKEKELKNICETLNKSLSSSVYVGDIWGRQTGENHK